MLPIRFYDMPGICEENSVRQNELDMILNGEVKRGLKVYIKIYLIWTCCIRYIFVLLFVSFTAIPTMFYRRFLYMQ